MAIPHASEEEISGRTLYGDNFSPGQIREWYDSEVTGYFDLLADHYKATDADNKYNYAYDALNQFHAIGRLLNRQFGTCLALGCAAGDDIAPLAPVVQQFIAIEPAEKWWHNEIGGKPATYMSPSARQMYLTSSVKSRVCSNPVDSSSCVSQFLRWAIGASREPA